MAAHNRQRNSTRIILAPRQVVDIVHEVAAVQATPEELQHFIEWLQGIDATDQDRAERELAQTPYAGLGRFLPQSSGDWYALIGVLLLILQIVLAEVHEAQERPPTVIVQIDEDRIIRELEQHIDERLDENADQEGREDQPR